MKPIQMVNLSDQYIKIKPEIDAAVLDCISAAAFINGPDVRRFEENLARYLGVRHVIGCANGTDALQIALMALELKPGDEVIVPAFTYVATAEVIALLGLNPVMVDVSPETFNVAAEIIERAITPKTRAIVPVHLFGQSCDMQPIVELARSRNIAVIEDNAQAIGSDYRDTAGTTRKSGTIGDIGCTSFFPSKNLGCFGDGGALFTDDDELAAKIRMIANHGQERKYYHSVVGVNSRLDTIQAAILDVKLKYLDEYCAARNLVADRYDQELGELEYVGTPIRESRSSHVFHQYTLKVSGRRDDLKRHLEINGVPSMIYYPLPLYKQKAFSGFAAPGFSLPVTEELCSKVLSLPIHTEMDDATQGYIIDAVKRFSA
ncbi:MAG: DegT/DnrJ/EryC1/StrS family aminotransferase [Acidobacteriota bacterium]